MRPQLRSAATLALCTLATTLALALPTWAQPVPPPGGPPPGGPPPAGSPAPKDLTKDAMQVLHAQRSAPEPGAPGTLAEIFPDSSKVWMSVVNVDPTPVEYARRGGPWVCASGCRLENGSARETPTGNEMLRSIKLTTPTLPLPITIWGRRGTDGKQTQLFFDPVLIGRRSYQHVCAYRPPEGPPAAGTKPKKPELCPHDAPPMPTPDSGELTLGLRWPDQSDSANFHYLAVVDSCGNARVMPFQRAFTVPVVEVASGGCGQPDGKALRVFPEGGWIRVTAFNLDEPASGDVVNLTYRVSVPPLENLVETEPARLLFPDAIVKDVKIDCAPLVLKAPPDAAGIPRPPPGVPAAPPGARPPQAKPPDADKDKPGDGKGEPPDAKSATKGKPGAAPPGAKPPSAPPPSGPPPPGADQTASTPGAKPLSHESLLIAPGPLRQGNCRLQIGGQLKRRLAAPMALRVVISRTDYEAIEQSGGSPQRLFDEPWILTPSADYLPIPPLRIDGDSRVRVEVYSDPLSPDGKAVLLSDANRVAMAPRRAQRDPKSIVDAQRLIGSVTVHTAPLCGESNFETLDAAGSCLRAYLTIPIMLASLQVTRAPWVEKPLVTRQFLNSIGVALAFDSYDPVERKAFPVALQFGGFLQQLEDNRVGILGYVGIAPTVPVLGEKGNTTSLGLLGGVGMSYIFTDVGPDEGIKPAAFLSIVVQVGQATPRLSAGAEEKANKSFSQGAVSARSSGSGSVSGSSGGYARRMEAQTSGRYAATEYDEPTREAPRDGDGDSTHANGRVEPEPPVEPAIEPDEPDDASAGLTVEVEEDEGD